MPSAALGSVINTIDLLHKINHLLSACILGIRIKSVLIFVKLNFASLHLMLSPTHASSPFLPSPHRLFLYPHHLGDLIKPFLNCFENDGLFIACCGG